QWSREFSLGRFSVTIVTGSPTSYLMPPRPCHAKSGQASFRILFEVGNEAGSHSTHEVSPSCLQEHTASPITGEQPYQLISAQHTRSTRPGASDCSPGSHRGGAPTKKPHPAPAPGANGCPPGSHRGGAPTRTSPGPVPCRSTRPGCEGARVSYPFNAATNSSSQGLASSSGVTVSLASRRSMGSSSLACTSSSSSRSCSPPW